MFEGIILIVITFWLLLIVLNCYVDAIQEDFEKEIGIKEMFRGRHNYNMQKEKSKILLFFPC
tara:strand:- start:28 stop:213 length:186 start_codon:yes stop_codon:yes gene_type:complete